MNKLVVACAIFLSNCVVHAQATRSSCHERDLIQESVKRYPQLKAYFTTPQSQRELGFCFAFSASLPLAQKFGVPFSAYSIADSVVFTQNGSRARGVGDPFTLIDKGASVVGTFDAIQGKEICTVGDKSTEAQISSTSQKFDHLRDAYLQIRRLQEQVRASGGLASNELAMAPACYAKSGIGTLFPGLNVSQFSDVLRESANRSYSYFLQNLDRRQCPTSHFKVPNFTYKLIPKSDPESMSREASQLIDQGRMAIISIRTDQGTGHALTLVGRKWIDGSCRFVVRNSAGGADACDHGNFIGPASVLTCQKDGTLALTEPAFDHIALEVGSVDP